MKSGFSAVLALSAFFAFATAEAKDKIPPTPAVICDAEHLNPLFDKKDRSGCQKTFDDTSNLGCSSASEFAVLLAAKRVCVRSNLDQLFDQRTVKMKDENPSEYKRETDLHITFLKAAEKFCKSTCKKGDANLWQTVNENCLAKLYEYRMNQVEEMNLDSVELPPVHNSKAYNGSDRVKSAFDSYAKLLCKIPAVWKDKKPGKDCEKRFVNQITIEFEVHKDPCDLS